ncbi:hypothetical protein [Saccharicrinis sp. 156]|uniref:hypothetical protein n=1 Tax=Saccharicrinis sp. 156 TaxID=3417574 RepID=UPI003D3561A7
MKKLAIIICGVLLLNACEEKDIRLYPSFEESSVFTINEQGYFEEEESISYFNILDAISDLEIEDGEIEDVTTEGIWIVITKLSGNTAESVTVDLSVGTENSGSQNLLKNLTIPIPDETTEIFLSSDLIKAGVNLLNSLFYNVIVGGSSVDDIEFELSGTTNPANSTVNIMLEVFVKEGVVVKQTIEGI